jgi:signal transduction histidine kinase
MDNYGDAITVHGRHRQPRLLIADDEPVIRELLARVVSDKGYDVTSADNGREALRKLQNEDFDVVFLDLRMPGIAGFDILSELAHRRQRMSVIIITGYGSLDTAREAMWNGCCDYITKPFDIADINRALDRAVQKCLDARRAGDEQQEEYIAQRLSRILRVCAATVHDINAVLIAAKHCFKGILRQSPRIAAQRGVRLMLSEIERAERMVVKALKFDAPDEAIFERVNIHRLIARSLSLLKYRMKHCNVDVKLMFARGIPLIACDPDLVEEALLNIFSNSLEAMPSGGTITVATTLEPGLLFLEICDTGTGIAPDTILRLSKPFFTTKTNGTGLGVAIVRRIMQQHQGTVRFRNETGGGTTVELRLPLQQRSGKDG